jgi:hypothetical protein
MDRERKLSSLSSCRNNVTNIATLLSCGVSARQGERHEEQERSADGAGARKVSRVVSGANERGNSFDERATSFGESE